MSPRVVVVAMVAAAVLLVASCADDEYVTLRAGECLPAGAEVVGTREPDPPRVPCSEPHRYEVYAVTTIDGPRTYPGEAAVDEAAQHECYLAFEPNVGYPAADMPDDVKVVYLQPTQSSWNGDDDRDVECLLIFDEDRTGSSLEPDSTEEGRG